MSLISMLLAVALGALVSAVVALVLFARRSAKHHKNIADAKQAAENLKSDKEKLEKSVTEKIAELEQAQNQIEQLQKLDAIGRLAGGVAHDFNNILGAIQMYCDLIERKISNQTTVLESIGQIVKATERGAAMTRQLLIFSRKKMGEPKPVQMNELLKEQFKMLQRLIGENIKIDFKLAAELPLITADPGQIEQVILNLVINARDAMANGGRLTIETKYEDLTEEFASTHLSSKLGPHVLISITDTGRGMSEAIKNQIFEPFFTTKAVGQGVGLGLSTVYGIVKSLEGTIWVYSEPDKGTVFKIYIPASEPIAAEETKSLDAENFGGTETILVVEDERQLRTLYGDALKQYGYTVHIAENGKVALELLNKLEVDLIVTDLIMPEMGGADLVRAVWEKRPQTKVLCMSGYPGENSEITAIEDDNFGYLQKPFNTVTLLQKIRALFATDSQTKDARLASGK